MTDEVLTQIKLKKDSLSQIASRQQKAAAHPEHSVWVEASAGTGKTKVLTDRVLRLLLSGISPSKILCLTYTKAAAVEMNDRLANRLASWAVMTDDKLENELKELVGGKVDDKLKSQARVLFATVLETPGGMKIQTIHSFCQEILKRFPLEAGISPYFSVMDDQTSKEALNGVCKKLILKIEQEPDTAQGQAIAYLTSHIKEFKFPDLLKTLTEKRNQIVRTLQKFHGISEFLAALRAKLGVKENESVEKAKEEFGLQLDLALIKQVAESLSQGTSTDVKKSEILYGCLQHFDYDAYKRAFLTKDGEIFDKLATQTLQKKIPDIVDKMQLLAFAVQDFEKHLQEIVLYNSTRAVMFIASDLASGYAEYKKQNSRLDYEDLVVLTRNLLEREGVAQWVLFKLDGGISHILIDEAQDTSPEQWAIIKAVTEEFFSGLGQSENVRTVFAVGDRKQSIYSFQGADPEEFDKMYKHFSTKAANFSKIRLDVSFRSTEAVLETVNHLFALDEAKSGVVIEGEAVCHLPYRVGEAGKVEVWELEEADTDTEDDIWYPPVERKVKASSSSKLAHRIALHIKNMVESGELLVSKNRPLKYSDFMVLVQRRNAFIEEFVRECKNLNVNISGVDKLKLLEQIAVEDLISLGKFLLLPEDDLSLAEVLKSPLFGLNDDDLFALCYNRGKESLWSRVKNNDKYQNVATELNELLNRSDYSRPFELFAYVLGPLKGRAKIVGRLGSEAEDAIDEFINLTLSFEDEHNPDLQSFINWISSSEIEVKREMEQEHGNAVRIMTAHGSKGLQAPIVILPDTTRVAKTDKSQGLLFGEDDLALYPLSAKEYDDNCLQIHEKNVQKQFDEYRRLLYVALTRAEDKLYICGYKQKNAVNEKSWYALCEKAFADFGFKDEKNHLCHESKQQFTPQGKEEEEGVKFAKVNKEVWLNLEANKETPLSKPYTPSRPEDEDDTPVASPLSESGNYFRRGTIIHKLLQFLPGQGSLAQKQELISAYLAKNAPELSKTAQEAIKHEVLSLLSDEKFGFIFGPGSQAEVPIMGEVEGKIISAQLDRLIVNQDKAVIVDFKTNRPAASTLQDVPAGYIRQLDIYKQLVAQIYPDKSVESYILWTNTSRLMKIN